MTQWIRWWGLGVFAAMAIFWWLCIDLVVKTAIETVGTTVVGAKVELANAAVTLLPASLVLTQLRVTNPSTPMSNIVAAENISVSIDTLHLFGRKIIVNEMIVTGLQFNTARNSSGAVTNQPAPESEGYNFDLGGAIPGMTLPSVDSLIAKEKSMLKKDYDDIGATLKKIKADWQQRVDELPDDKQLDEYKQRWKKAKEGNFLQKIVVIKSLKKAIDKDLRNIKRLRKQLANDTQAAKSELNRAKNLPAAQAKRMLSDLGLDAEGSSFVSAFAGDQLKRLLQQALTQLKKIASPSPSKKTEELAYQRGKGTWVTFNETQPLPELLIKVARLEGVFNIGDEDIRFTGEAQNLSHQPSRWREPASFQLQGKSTGNTSLVANGVFDHRTPANKDTVDVTIEKLPLVDYALSEKPALQIAVKKALAHINATLLLNGEAINANIDATFNKVDLQIDSDNPSTTTSVIKDTLSSVNSFDLSLNIQGTLSQPGISLRSDLDNILGKALKSKLKQQANELKGKLTQKLKQQMAPELEKLTQQKDFIAALEKQLVNQQSMLKKLSL